MINEKYEISIWKDILVSGENIPQHFEEKKIAIIGSQNMTTKCRAIEPKLVKNINGTNTFTFKMFYTYIEDSGEKYKNPYINLLTNESKIKVYWKKKWYDFIIKNIQESSQDKTVFYTCKDAFINELSKNGFSLEFDDELGNNQGSVIELGEKILQDTDWKIKKDASDILSQTIEEPLYEIPCSSGFTANCIEPNNNNTDFIETDSTILVFYSSLHAEEEDKIFQLTADTEVQQGKDYYKEEQGEKKLVINPSNSELNNLYEINKNLQLQFLYVYNYKKTEDTSIDTKKTYYEKADFDGIEALKRVDNPIKENLSFYFEKKENNGYVTENNNRLVNNASNYKVNLYKWKWDYQNKTWEAYAFSSTQNTAYLVFSYHIDSLVSNKYRGNRLVLSQLQELDSRIGKNVSLFDLFTITYDTTPIEGKEYYIKDANGNFILKETDINLSEGNYYEKDKVRGYEETEYIEPEIVNNLVTNSSDFKDYTGWNNSESLMIVLDPPLNSENIINYKATSFLYVPRTREDQTPINEYLFNNGIRDNSPKLKDGFKVGETYIFRMQIYDVDFQTGKFQVGKQILDGNSDYSNIRFRVASYQLEQETYLFTDYFEPKDSSTYIREKDSNGEEWLMQELVCIKEVKSSEFFRENISFLLDNSQSIYNFFIKKIEFFPKKMGLFLSEDNLKESRINPGDLNKLVVPQTRYYYYSIAENQQNSKKEDIEYLYVGYLPWSEDNFNFEKTLVPLYDKNCEKKRSIRVKRSNRFNLLQTLAEVFKCWVVFEVEHNEKTGELIYDSQNNYKPKKYVFFKENIGKKIGIGFTYGLDLKTVSRTVMSDQIATKVIVLPNKNQFAKFHSCSINQSVENYSLENFILNFDYYINQNLLELETLNKDLYSSGYNDLGYFYHLHNYNKKYVELEQDLLAKNRELEKQEEFIIFYQELITSVIEELRQAKQEMCDIAGVQEVEQADEFILAHLDLFTEKLVQISILQHNQSSYELLLKNLKEGNTQLKDQIKVLNQEEKKYKTKIIELHNKFYAKYSRFIQEGTWTSEEYFDENLYYLDACNVTDTSAKPQVNYNISVIRLSDLEDYYLRNFEVGDITYIQDVDFFGYIMKETEQGIIKTPIKEPVLISEATFFFDSPEKDSFQIQNYKTRFEDLFQRVTATTQSLKEASGGFQQAADSFEPNGALKGSSLQDSINHNNNLVVSAKNESIIQDSTGITVSNIIRPNEKTKITSGGIFITQDGENWKNAVHGSGIVTNLLTAGAIDVNNITLKNGSIPSFRWDSKGLNAFKTSEKRGENPLDLGTFIRFDQYGLYGIQHYIGDFDPEIADESGNVGENKIWNSGTFGFTWNGFFLNNKINKNLISISTENDFLIATDGLERIKIGRIDKVKEKYGIRLSQIEEINGKKVSVPVMETDETGQLWLKNALQIETSTGKKVKIGKLSNQEVINANDNFIVYEDGRIKASSGTIGTMSIDTIENLGYKVEIISSKGTIFQNHKGSTELTVNVYKDGEIINKTIEGNPLKFTYKWYKGTELLAETSASITVEAPKGENNNISYNCIVTIEER